LGPRDCPEEVEGSRSIAGSCWIDSPRLATSTSGHGQEQRIVTGAAGALEHGGQGDIERGLQLTTMATSRLQLMMTAGIAWPPWLKPTP
jgi:hypothetical protein